MSTLHVMTMNNPIVYTVTVIDLYTDKVLGIRRTPAIFTQFKYAVLAIKNNTDDLADGLTYQYAVIEETMLDVIRPCVHEIKSNKWWYKYNSVLDEFEESNAPPQLMNQSGFGIG